MAYIERDQNNKIVAIHKNPPENTAPQTVEEMDNTMHEVLAFLLPESWNLDSSEFLKESDLSMVRVVEDLVTILIDKNLIAFTDLPEAAITKILMRRQIREKMSEIGNIVS